MNATDALKPVIGIDDAFGLRARQLRSLQSRLLAIYQEAGYSEVIPPLVERPESLGCGTRRFLSDQTVVFSDPAGAGLLAIRPDMTPQIARIAATRMGGEQVLRLCYSGMVMLARPEARSGRRQQWQTGIELLGVAGDTADVEVMHLAALSLHAAGFSRPVLTVGHVGLLTALVEGSTLPLQSWVAILARRSPDDMARQLMQESLPEKRRQALLELATGNTDTTWLARHKNELGQDFATAAVALLYLLDEVAARLKGEVEVVLDAAVMPRFLYHSGIVFSAFAPGAAQALLHGGRYDTVMASFGRDMPATGFSCDLWAWLDAGGAAGVKGG